MHLQCYICIIISLCFSQTPKAKIWKKFQISTVKSKKSHSISQVPTFKLCWGIISKTEIDKLKYMIRTIHMFLQNRNRIIVVHTIQETKYLNCLNCNFQKSSYRTIYFSRRKILQSAFASAYFDFCIVYNFSIDIITIPLTRFII